jgi:polyisoprenyl-phosphate glycosyltransferase
MKTISILTPCFNEEDNVAEVHDRVKSAMLQLPNYGYEHVFIDNCSTDGTVGVLKNLAARDPHLKIIVNARNFGPIRSSMHGLFQTVGDAVVGIVADLQDPPELIPELVKKWEEGFAMVLCIKRTSDEPALMFWIRKMYYRTIRRLSSIRTFENFTGFGLFDRRVIEAIRSFDDPYPYFRGMIAEVGLPYYELLYDQPRRRRGSSKSNFYSLYDMAMVGITQLSKVPLRIVTFSGFVSSALCIFLGLAYFIYKLLFWSSFSLGVAPLVIGLFFFGSIQMLSLGIIGEYVASIQTQVQRRPYVIEKERINFAEPGMQERAHSA